MGQGDGYGDSLHSSIRADKLVHIHTLLSHNYGPNHQPITGRRTHRTNQIFPEYLI